MIEDYDFKELLSRFNQLEDKINYELEPKINNKNNPVVIKIKGPIPIYKTEDAAGFDIASNEDVDFSPNETKLIKTGMFVEIPKGYEIQIRTRSGLALKGITVSNSPGTIDSDFRGLVCVILKSEDYFKICKGDRIAQGVLCKVERAVFQQSEELSNTNRGEKGFGSTGV